MYVVALRQNTGILHELQLWRQPCINYLVIYSSEPAWTHKLQGYLNNVSKVKKWMPGMEPFIPLLSIYMFFSERKRKKTWKRGQINFPAVFMVLLHTRVHIELSPANKNKYPAVTVESERWNNMTNVSRWMIKLLDEKQHCWIEQNVCGWGMRCIALNVRHSVISSYNT